MTLASDQTDSWLLEQFLRRRSQQAFTELVGRYSDMVYSVALRQVRDRHLAEDVTQAVFLVLAERARDLKPPLHGWLFKVTRYASANARRSQARREVYERRAAMLKTEEYSPEPAAGWDDMAPLLDSLIARLRTADRDVLLLRFYQHKSMAEVSGVLGVSEGAAKTRVRRALDRLRKMFGARGIAVPADALGAVLLTNAVHPAPAGMVASCCGGSAPASAIGIAKQASVALNAAKAKLAAATLLLCLFIFGGFEAGRFAWNRYGASPSVQAVPADSSETSLSAPVASPVPGAAMPAEIASGDAALVPFLNAHTDEVFALDLASIDFDAIDLARARLLREMGADPAQWDRTYVRENERLQGFSPELTARYRSWLGQMQRSGANTIYFLSQTGGRDGAAAGTAVIVPLKPDANRADLLNLFADLPFIPKVIRGSIVLAAPRLESDLQTRQPAARADLLAALAAAPGTLRWAISIPTIRRATLPEGQGMSADVGAFSFFRDPAWNNAVWISQAWNSPPHEGGSIVIQCTSPAHAADLAMRINQKILRFKAVPPPHDGSDEVDRVLAASRNITVAGDRITATVDGQTMDQIMFIESPVRFVRK